MIGAEFLGHSRRMKGITEADETGDFFGVIEFVGEEARDAAAEGFTANYEALLRMLFADGFDDGSVFSDERFGAGRRTLRATVTATSHVGEFEKGERQPPSDEKIGHHLQERRSNPRPCAMR